MGDISVTAADVRPLPGATVQRFTAGGTLAIGDAVYVDSSGTVQRADGSTVGTVWAIGIAVSTPGGKTTVASGDRVDVVTAGPVTGFSGMTPGTLTYISDTAGALATAVGTKDTIVGIAISAVTVSVNIQYIDLS